jgi:hypothetical protein
MSEFLMLFRSDVSLERPSPEQMQAMMKQWQDWMGSIAAQNKLASAGNRLTAEHAKIVKPGGVITNGPFVELKEAVGGYIIVKCESADEAAELAKGCPIMHVGGSVEVRLVIPM